MSKNPRGVSFDEEKALELYNQGLTDREIGEKLFVSSSSICGWRHRRGLPANYSPMYRGKRPEVTVEVPEGLKTVKEREEGEPTNAEPAQEIKPCPAEEGKPCPEREEKPDITDAGDPAAAGPVEIALSLGGGDVSLRAEDLDRAGELAGILRDLIDSMERKGEHGKR